MSPRELRGVVFDMDGVLVDSHAAHRKAWRLFFQTIQRDVPEAELDFILDGRKRCDILRHFLGDCADSEIEEYGRRKDCIFQQVRLEVAPVPGAIRCVTELHQEGIALALATSASRSRARSTLHELGLLDCFPVIVTGEDVCIGKPDAAIYRLACARMGIEASHLLAIEDAVSGIRAAVGAGLRCIGIALQQAANTLIAEGAMEALPDLQSVSAEHLERIFRGKVSSSHFPASAVAR